VTETYRPTADEVGAFNEDLNRYTREAWAEGDEFTARDLRCWPKSTGPARTSA
jgi:hypothetical protein